MEFVGKFMSVFLKVTSNYANHLKLLILNYANLFIETSGKYKC